MIYLDTAAATPMDTDVAAAMQPFFTEQFYNPSANYMAAQQVRARLDDARADIAAVLGARASEIIFTAGGTESDNLAIHGVMQQYPDAHLIVSSVEHDAVLEPAAQYNRALAPVNAQGLVDVAALEQLIQDDTVLVSVMYANNEVGTVQPIRRIAQVIQRVRDARRKSGNTMPIYFHTDACQAANYLDLHAARLGVDMMTLNGGKIYGPKQSGVLYVASKVLLRSVLQGGGQERNLRSGTENVAACVGFAAALQKAQNMRHDESKRLQALQAQAFTLLQEKLPGVVVNGSQEYRLPNNVHITLPGQDNERLLVELDEREIVAAAGSACSASSDTPSHVLRAMGVADEDAQASLRVTMGRASSEQDVTTLIDTLVQLAA